MRAGKQIRIFVLHNNTARGYSKLRTKESGEADRIYTEFSKETEHFSTHEEAVVALGIGIYDEDAIFAIHEMFVPEGWFNK